MTRTLRLVVLVHRFNEIFATFVDLLPAVSTLFGMMWTVFSVFASVGMMLFGGKIRYSSNALNGTEFAKSNYYANNFNDFTSSLITLFELLVVNNWQVLMDGFVHVTYPSYRWFFILFWSIAVIVILNLVVAFILEAFFSKDDARRSQGNNDSEDIREMHLMHDNSLRGDSSIQPPKRRFSILNLHEGFY